MSKTNTNNISMKEMTNSMFEGIEKLYIKALAKAGIDISLLGSADDEMVIMFRDAMKMYNDAKQYSYAYAAIIDEQREQISKMNEKMDNMLTKIDELSAASSKASKRSIKTDIDE